MRYTPKRSKKSRTYLHIVRIIAVAVLVMMLFIFVGIPKNDSETELPVYTSVPTNKVELPNETPMVTHTPAPTPTPTPEPTPTITWYYTDEDVITMAKVMYREARGVGSTTQIACIGWVACNRVDAGAFGDTITEVLTAPDQFAWIPDTPVEDWLVEIAEDVLQKWSIEKSTGECCGRVLPAEYLYFHGDGKANWFRIEYEHNNQYWDYSLPSPYES